ncbi:hypothetical protein [Chryseobacterium sp.]|uniref:hypothetical protein n=1 Tax=Chryseobacterium sp. TaxID=1871047 RepID=UPI0025BEE625|nr:hypothetical protein [Chryseobacterium sp.]
MMSIIILVGAYRYYAGLAGEYGRTKWHFGLLAIAVYFGAHIAFGFSYGFYKEMTQPGSLEEESYNTFSFINLVGWIISILAVYVFYKILEKKFEKGKQQKPLLEIEEIGNNEQL